MLVFTSGETRPGQASDAPPQETWLIDLNPFDIGVRNPLRPHALADVDPRQGLNPQPSA